MILTQEQQAIVESTAARRVVIARPGTGKTTVLVEVLADLAQNRGRSPECIAALTFTRNAAHTLRVRLAARIGDAASNLTIETSTSLALRILRSSVPRPIAVYDEHDRMEILADILNSMKLRASRKDVLAALRARRRHAGGIWPLPAVRAAEAYDDRLRLANAIDLEDVIPKATRVLEAGERLADHWRYRTKYLVVDEYQDTSAAEQALYQAFQPEHFTAVGDPNQELYGFRGARGTYLIANAAAPDAGVYYLTTGFRCSAAVAGAANALIRHNPDGGAHSPEVCLEALQPTEAPGKVRVRVAENYEDLEAFVRRRAARALKRELTMAILCRTNSEAGFFLGALTRAGVACHQITSGREFYGLPEVRAFHAYLRAIVNPRDEVATLHVLGTWRTVPVRGTPEWSAARRRMIEEDRSFLEVVGFPPPDWPRDLRGAAEHASEHLEYFYHDGAAEKIGNLEEARARVYRWLDDGHPNEVEAFVGWLAAKDIEGLETREIPPSSVAVGTIHAAKGLEWDVVVIPGLELGRFPHHGSDVAEERRILYVGITRARHDAYLLACTFGHRQPSPFLEELRDG